MKFSVFTVLVLSSVVAFSAVKKDELNIALNAEFETLNPLVNSMMAAVYILDATARPLVALTPEGKAYPVLIKEIPSIENSKASFIKHEKNKGLKADIEILAKAKWGDGVDMTCQDVKVAWQIGKDDKVSTPNREDYLNIEDIQIDAKNPKKCSILFKEARWSFYLNFPRPIPAHLEGPVFQQFQSQAQGYERNSLYVKAPTNPGLYNGPYVVSELKLGSHIVLSANPQFQGKPAYFKKVIFKFILNSSTMESNLVAGSVDMTSSSGLSFDQALNFEKKISEQKLPYKVIFVPGVIYGHIDFNLDHPALKDLKIRKALAYAVDREEMAKAFYSGKQKVALHFSTQLDSWYTDKPSEIVTYAYDKKKAEAFLGNKLGVKNEKIKIRANIFLEICFIFIIFLFLVIYLIFTLNSLK
jgi:peptide/nickel transport system substrate-binding protein